MADEIFFGNLNYYTVTDKGLEPMYGNDITITVDKNELLDILRKNREKHEKNYQKAKEGFRLLLIKELKKKLDDTRAGKKVALNFKNQKPDSHLGDYDEIIGMLELAKDETFSISSSQYKQYVKDDWNWSRNWSTSNSAYISAVSA